MTAASLTIGDDVITLDADEWTALRWASFLCGHQGGAEGRLLSSGGSFEPAARAELLAFVARVRARFGDDLAVYEHGHGTGTIILGQPALELVHQLGLRYRKRLARYVPGQPGKLDRYEDVVMRKGRTTTGPAQQVGDVAPLRSALDHIEAACRLADNRGVALAVAPAEAIEYF